MGTERYVKLHTELSPVEVLALLPVDDAFGFENEPIHHVTGTRSLVEVRQSQPEYGWECLFGIDWNTSISIEYERDEDVHSTSDLLDAHIGALIKASKRGWVQHLDLPILYWTQNKVVVTSNESYHKIVAQSLQEAGIPFGFADMDANSGDIDQLLRDRWVDDVYQRLGSGPYFNTDVADRWQKKWWGWWGFAMQHLGVEVGHDNIVHFQDPKAAPELRQEVVQYLRSAQYTVTFQQPATKCSYCDELVGPHHQWDGVWLWDEILAHHVEAHDFIVPNELVDRIRLLGSPLQLAPVGPHTKLPSPSSPE